MAATETRQTFNHTNPTFIQAVEPDRPRVPIVAHIITDDDIGLLQVKIWFDVILNTSQ